MRSPQPDDQPWDAGLRSYQIEYEPRDKSTPSILHAPTPLQYVPRVIVTDKLRSYAVAQRQLLPKVEHRQSRYLNNRAENSHQPFRRRERAMQLFRSARTLQKFSSIQAQVHNHFNQERHLVTREVYKQRRSAALVEWRSLAA